jgi:RHS repeat-associated protein
MTGFSTGPPSRHRNARPSYTGCSVSISARPCETGTRSFYHRNALGSVMEITDMNQAVVVSYRYDPYGKVTITRGGTPQSSDPLGNHWTFTGRFLDEEAGLLYYRARYYDPATGRLMQRDPLGYPEGPSLFAYAASSPTNACGRDWWWGTPWDLDLMPDQTYATTAAAAATAAPGALPWFVPIRCFPPIPWWWQYDDPGSYNRAGGPGGRQKMFRMRRLLIDVDVLIRRFWFMIRPGPPTPIKTVVPEGQRRAPRESWEHFIYSRLYERAMGLRERMRAVMNSPIEPTNEQIDELAAETRLLRNLDKSVGS